MKYDLVIIGGGPAGMMAAGTAGEGGTRVLLLEKNISLGNKLFLTGHGRCNITNKIDNHKLLASRYGIKGRFLLSALSQFDPGSAIEFFNSNGVATKIEDNNRVLPKSNQARDVLNALLAYLKKGNVEIKTGSAVKQIIADKDKITKVILASGKEIIADNFIIATGGKSYPGTGSTGDAYAWLKQLGHAVAPPLPILTGINVKEKLIKDLEGISLSEIKISAISNGKIIATETGDLIFTGLGLSGPATINLSRLIIDTPKKDLLLSIDLLPEFNEADLDKQLQQLFIQQNNKAIKNCLAEITSTKLALTILRLAKIDQDKQVNSVTRAERLSIVSLIKNLNLTFADTEGFEKAIVTRGGVILAEIDQKTMKSKLIDNLYFAGEILDLDGPTGGFNLQICWTTGYVAGASATKK